MKAILLLVAFTFTCVAVNAANVVFNLTDFLGTVQNLQRKPVFVDPLSTVRQNGSNVVLSERRMFNTGTNGIFMATNINEGEYRVTVYGATRTNVFRINVPDTNGTLTASDLLITANTTALETEEGQTLDLE